MQTLAQVLGAVFVLIWAAAVITWVYGVVHSTRARKYFHPPPPASGRSTEFARFDVTNYDVIGQPSVARARNAMFVFMALVVSGFVVMAIVLIIFGSQRAS